MTEFIISTAGNITMMVLISGVLNDAHPAIIAFVGIAAILYYGFTAYLLHNKDKTIARLEHGIRIMELNVDKLINNVEYLRGEMEEHGYVFNTINEQDTEEEDA